ncbi:hypothetical protein SCLCIDRAFT_70374, partial [Scleroderma citrinum Foug A]
SGAQAHISVHSTTGRSPLSNAHPTFHTTLECQFLAGLVTHLSAVTVFVLPIPRCYTEIPADDVFFALGSWVSWGLDHRAVPVRILHPSSPKSLHFEIRLVDGTASPYLVLSGLLSA